MAWIPRFNPTLVRLRLGNIAALIVGFYLFQSHAGSIEAPKPAGKETYISRVSIPRWFD